MSAEPMAMAEPGSRFSDVSSRLTTLASESMRLSEEFEKRLEGFLEPPTPEDAAGEPAEKFPDAIEPLYTASEKLRDTNKSLKNILERLAI